MSRGKRTNKFRKITTTLGGVRETWGIRQQNVKFISSIYFYSREKTSAQKQLFKLLEYFSEHTYISPFECFYHNGQILCNAGETILCHHSLKFCVRKQSFEKKKRIFMSHVAIAISDKLRGDLSAGQTYRSQHIFMRRDSDQYVCPESHSLPEETCGHDWMSDIPSCIDSFCFLCKIHV